MKNLAKFVFCTSSFCLYHASADAQTSAKKMGDPVVVSTNTEQKKAQKMAQGKTLETLKTDPAYKSATLDKRIAMRNAVTTNAVSTAPANSTVAQSTSSDGKTVQALKKNVPNETNEDKGAIEKDPETKNPDGSTTQCSTQKVTITAGYSESIMLNPTAQFVFVGNIMDGSTIPTGGYAMYNHPTAKRLPINISNDIQTTVGQSNATKTVQPDATSGHLLRGAVMNAMNDLTTSALGNGQAIPGNIGQTTETVSAFNQMTASFNLSFDAPPALMRGALSLSGGTSSKKSKVAVKFVQPYYAMFLDTDPKTLYPAGTTIPDHAVVVSQVTYGRIGMFIFESEASTDSLSMMVEFAMSTAGGSSLNTDTKSFMQRVMEKTVIKSYILGSSTQAANEAACSLEDFNKFMKTGGNWSASQPAAPIAYRLSFVKDGQVASLHTTTTFNERNCVITAKAKSTKTSVTIGKLVPNHNGRDFCGNIAVAAFYKDAAGNEIEVPNSRKLLMDVACEKNKWWKNTKKEGHDINASYEYTFDAAKAATGFIRVFFDIRDGIQGIEKPFNNKDYNQYEKKTKDFPAGVTPEKQGDSMIPVTQKMYMEGKPNQTVEITMFPKSTTIE
jgi:Thiol-activated cytolysin